MTAAWRKFGAWLSAVSPKGAKSSEEPCRFLTASARFVGRLEGFGVGPLGRGEGSEHRHRAPWNKRHAQLRKTCALRLALRFLFSGFEENNFKERLYQATSRLEPPRAADAGIPRFKSATLFCCFVSFFGFSPEALEVYHKKQDLFRQIQQNGPSPSRAYTASPLHA